MTGPQFAPMPGDVMTDPYDATYTVTSVDGDTVFCDYRLKGDDTVAMSTTWFRAVWSLDCGGDFTYARPGAS